MRKYKELTLGVLFSLSIVGCTTTGVISVQPSPYVSPTVSSNTQPSNSPTPVSSSSVSPSPSISPIPVSSVSVSTVAGDGTQGYIDLKGTLVRFMAPKASITDKNGNIFVIDENRIRKVTADGTVSTVAGDGTNGYADGTGSSAKFNQPQGITIDSSGNLFVADSHNNRIRKITSSGFVTTLAGHDTASYTDATGSKAGFSNPEGITIDSTGNLYVTDTSNGRVRKITSDGVVTTIAGNDKASVIDGTGTNASFIRPEEITIDSNNNLYVIDTNTHSIRKITSGGVVTNLDAVLEDPVTKPINYLRTLFSTLRGIVTDKNGNLFVVDTWDNKIKKVSADGKVTTIAGDGTSGFADGLGSSAKFAAPQGISIDSTGNLYISDNLRIRKISFS